MKKDETSDTDSFRRIAIDPVSRVEGHGKVTLLVDKHHQVQQARLHIVEFRGFERFIQGRPYWELPMIVQRLCGICPVSHHLAAGKAIDMLIGSEQLSDTADKTRRLLHYGQVLQSHALHFFHLASPDLLFGDGVSANDRNFIHLLDCHSEIAMKGVKLRKFGQKIIEAISGKRVHGSIAIPGGINRNLSTTQISSLQQQLDEVKPWLQEAVELAKKLYLGASHQQFAAITSPILSMVNDAGEFELYHGGLRARRDNGTLLFDQVNYCDYSKHILEEVKPWSYMKFPFLDALGKEKGWYRVGPLARVLNCDGMGFPVSEQARIDLMNCCPASEQSSLLYHWARMIELLYCGEAIEELLYDPVLLGSQLTVEPGIRQPECFGVIEAPRGTLIHHYIVDDQDLIQKANLIVSTTSNNQAMNMAIQDVCQKELNGNEITERLLNRVEMAIRAYDPCLSCATHAIGQMPLQIEVHSLSGDVVSKAGRDDTGAFSLMSGVSAESTGYATAHEN
ncbi:Ni/Fe hydrogenase subunit alpha [Motiliproteus sp. MSK22-1]|uniref:Ni/Fe hydrogenase subunit alpha n=1 Tax=Motiliproteus sp. MSK22-1 TaxID=1897630 RepID=UPI0009782E62|nr:Ni/Fe hydrogenase subunit alpha [Motiliproteus sp. MSK22-1]OMH32715.1 NADP oxidoreductase [Motiliproteus sp. MSK22-1]